MEKPTTFLKMVWKTLDTIITWARSNYLLCYSSLFKVEQKKKSTDKTGKQSAQKPSQDLDLLLDLGDGMFVRQPGLF